MGKSAYFLGGYHEDFMRDIESELREFSNKYKIGLTVIVSIWDDHKSAEDYEAKISAGSDFPLQYNGEMRIDFTHSGGGHFTDGQALFPDLKLEDGFTGFRLSSSSVKTMGDWSTVTRCEPIFNSMDWDEYYLEKP